MIHDLMYIELKTGYSDDGPAWIGYVKTSKSKKTIYFNNHAFQKYNGNYSNYIDIENGDEYWIDFYSQDYLDTLLNTDNIIENTAFNNMDYEFLFSIIMELPCDQYRILYLKLFEEYTFEEIAKTMKWKSGKVSKSYYNGIEYLKERMKYYFQK